MMISDWYWYQIVEYNKLHQNQAIKMLNSVDKLMNRTLHLHVHYLHVWLFITFTCTLPACMMIIHYIYMYITSMYDDYSLHLHVHYLHVWLFITFTCTLPACMMIIHYIYMYITCMYDYSLHLHVHYLHVWWLFITSIHVNTSRVEKIIKDVEEVKEVVIGKEHLSRDKSNVVIVCDETGCKEVEPKTNKQSEDQYSYG
jgi:hypothetical protein